MVDGEFLAWPSPTNGIGLAAAAPFLVRDHHALLVELAKRAVPHGALSAPALDLNAQHAGYVLELVDEGPRPGRYEAAPLE